MRIDPVLRAHRGSVIAGSIVIPVLACWLLSLVRSGIANTNAALGLVLLVVAAASTGIRVAGIAAALAAAAGFDFFLTEPFRTFSIHSSADLATALLLLIVGAAVSEIAIWGRRQQAQASREQGYLDGLLSTAAAVAAGTATPTELINLVANQIVGLLHIDGCHFDPAVHYGLPALSTEGILTGTGTTSTSAARACRRTHRSPCRSAMPEPYTGTTFSLPPPELCDHRARNSASPACLPNRSAALSPPGQRCPPTELP